MTTLDQKIRPKVAVTLATYGADATLTELVNAPVVATGDNPQAGAGSWSIKVSPPKTLSAYVQATSRTTATARTVLAASDVDGVDVAFVPKTGWKLLVGSNLYRVVSVAEIKSGDQVAAWTLGLIGG